MKNSIIAAYLDYFNNFGTVAKFAECYGISRLFALALIEEGRRLNEENAALAKLRHHVSGAIARGEAKAIVGIPA